MTIGLKGPRAIVRSTTGWRGPREAASQRSSSSAKGSAGTSRGIEAAMSYKVSNGLIESTNTKLRALHRMAFGFKKPEHLVALTLLVRNGYCPRLSGRRAA